ncbi:hypothetical protein CONPUDRAFT_56946 [Coniophora puteana RWD-64-598 SS2]|uniref:Uncharacterized protein n=1 Tax=Coniophora puteana (strain RWD-64-598) TaxID=741705 RepID=A0A5M3MMU7_CONPW|nr:uncharacterized protein CONPUDRAFT_56946 [Coniophora puteana RWD-64-598 SS2]EIW80356.1 hypothetical protein CONPUDRAFT_56946 [Coniophora puteana RWD-64-598 SS2]
MPTAFVLLDDQSPLITYDDTWAYGYSWGDDTISYYYRGTFTVSAQPNAQSATFSLNGTGVAVYGSQRFNHGEYSVSVDGQTNTADGYSSTNAFQKALFTQSGLQQGMHSITITNTGSGNKTDFDVDFVTWEFEVGDDSQGLLSVQVQDTDPSFDYQPASAWSDSPSQAYMYNNGSAHATSVDGASVTLTFTASDVINLYGTAGPSNGFYSVSMDGVAGDTYNATRYLTSYQNIIYHANNLGPGEHKLTVTSQPQAGGQYLNIDYAEVMVLTK